MFQVRSFEEAGQPCEVLLEERPRSARPPPHHPSPVLVPVELERPAASAQMLIQGAEPEHRLSLECRDLWQTRQALAGDPDFLQHHHPNNLNLNMNYSNNNNNNTSTDLASDDPSTSFESNTVAVDAAAAQAGEHSAAPDGQPFSRPHPLSADVRRLRYRALLLQKKRQQLHRGGAHSSSVDSAGPSNRFGALS